MFSFDLKKLSVQAQPQGVIGHEMRAAVFVVCKLN